VPAGVPGRLTGGLTEGLLESQPACSAPRISSSPAQKQPILRFLDFLSLIPTATRAIPSNDSQNAYKGLMRSRPNEGARRAETAVVEILNVEVAGLAPTVTEENEQFANAGNPLQVSDTDPVKLLVELIVMVDVAAPPAETVAAPGEAEIVKSGDPKFPSRGTVCGLPAALSLIVSVPLRVPATVGVKVTLKAQLAPGASAAGSVPQVFVWAKSPPFVPAIVIPVMVKAPSPLFVSVTCWGGLVVLIGWGDAGVGVKDRLAGDVATAGPGMGAIFDTKASAKPRKDVCSGFTVGKSVEEVFPVP